MAHPCPGPSPRDNNGRSRSRSRLSSSPPESLEGAGAGGGPRAAPQRLPPSPALCLAHEWPRSHPAIRTHPRGGRAGGTQRQHFGDSESPPLAPAGPRRCCLTGRVSPLQTGCQIPPPAALCLGVPGHCLRGRDPERQSEVMSISPAASLLAREEAASAPWPPGHCPPDLVPTSPFLPCFKEPCGAKSVSLLGSGWWLGRGNPWGRNGPTLLLDIRESRY